MKRRTKTRPQTQSSLCAQSGAALVEVGLVIALVAVAAIPAVTYMGRETRVPNCTATAWLYHANSDAKVGENVANYNAGYDRATDTCIRSVVAYAPPIGPGKNFWPLS